MARLKLKASCTPGVSRRADGKWIARLTRSREDGTREQESRVFERKDDAEDWVIGKRNERRFGTSGLSAPGAGRSPLTLKTILGDYVRELAVVGASKGHTHRVEQVADVLCRGLGGNHPVPLERADLVRFVAWGRANTKTKGDLFARAFVIVRTAHKRANLIPPAAPEIRFERRGRRRFEHDVVVRFIAAMPIGSPERTAAEIMFRTAARLTEVLRLTGGDVDLRAGVLRIETRKGPKAARVRTLEYPISAAFEKVLRAATADRGAVPINLPPETPLLRLRGKTVRGPASLRKRLLAASRRARAEVLLTHPELATKAPDEIFPTIASLAWIRNHVVTQLREAGVTLETTSRIAGHASVTTTQRHYDRSVLWEARKAAAEKLDALISGASDGTHMGHTPAVDSRRKA